ncbi:MAG: 6-carboxytetrahydropterin synthase [Phycisphaerales bacterium]
MHELSRRVRFSLSPARLGGVADASDDAAVGAFYELEVTCRGEPNAVTGYLVNISVIDEAVRTHALGLLGDAVAGWVAGSDRAAGDVLVSVVTALQPPLAGAVIAVRWWLSPYHWIRCEANRMDRILLSRQFEFSAAHRLHCPQYSDQENRDLFGKCNNPTGHGHNYKVETTVSVGLEPAGTAFGFADLQRLVQEHVIERFDHKHLNLDTPEFAELNPSVEHIARVCHESLAAPVAAAGATLEYVTVWETDKTSCRYPATLIP